MNRDEVRDIVNRTFYRSLEESETDINALPPGQLQALVRAFSDSMVAVLQSLDDESATGSLKSSSQERVEELLGSGRPLMSVTRRYELTTQRIRIIEGFVSKRLEEIDLVRIRDTKVKQNAGERLTNVGDITIFSSDRSAPEVVLDNVNNPIEVREMIRKAYLAEQERRGLKFREE